MQDVQESMKFQLKVGQHIHVVGIGGAGMSAIARLLLERGFVVSGSDRQVNARTEALGDDGAKVFTGHSAEHVTEADLLLISSAIPVDNPELVTARNAGIPILKRADFLGTLMQDKIGVAVAGTHGKTTTTGMIAHILLQAKQDPSVIVGGTLPELGTNGRAGMGDAFVVEADEYDHMFLGLRPQIGVITNIEHDHPDIFPTERVYRQAFIEFAHLLPADGKLILCADDKGIQQMLWQGRFAEVELVGYGQEKMPAVAHNYQAVDLRPNQLGGTDFLVTNNDESLGIARLALPGVHNVLNGLAAIVVALQLGVSFQEIIKGLATFAGMGRRFELVGTAKGVTVVDDYAHHPTEIRATLQATKQRFPERQIWAVWQPHTYSRTRLLLQEFAGSFINADQVIILDIYRSREKEEPNLSSGTVLRMMNHPNARHLPTHGDAVAYLLEHVQQDDVVITLGAGDGDKVGRRLLRDLED